MSYEIEVKQNPWGLTAREQGSLVAIVNGDGAKGAARLMGISNRTVDNHLASARRKMGVGTTLHAVLLLDREQRAELSQTSDTRFPLGTTAS